MALAENSSIRLEDIPRYTSPISPWSAEFVVPHDSPCVVDLSPSPSTACKGPVKFPMVIGGWITPYSTSFYKTFCPDCQSNVGVILPRVADLTQGRLPSQKEVVLVSGGSILFLYSQLHENHRPVKRDNSGIMRGETAIGQRITFACCDPLLSRKQVDVPVARNPLDPGLLKEALRTAPSPNGIRCHDAVTVEYYPEQANQPIPAEWLRGVPFGCTKSHSQVFRLQAVDLTFPKNPELGKTYKELILSYA